MKPQLHQHCQNMKNMLYVRTSVNNRVHGGTRGNCIILVGSTSSRIEKSEWKQYSRANDGLGLILILLHLKLGRYQRLNFVKFSKVHVYYHDG